MRPTCPAPGSSAPRRRWRASSRRTRSIRSMAAARSPTPSMSPTRCTQRRSRSPSTSTGRSPRKPSARSSPMRRSQSWLRLLGELSPRRRLGLALLSFILPLALWSAVSYLPFLWHPMVKIEDPGGVSWFARGQLVDREAFGTENAAARARGAAPATGEPANPVFLPAPHRVAQALVTAFTSPPARPDELWLHQSLWHSITVIFWGFFLSSLVGVPLGILCGA